MVPYDRNPYFLGRDDLLRELRQKLQETNPRKYNHRIAVYGMGGVGKTQLTIEYVHRHEKDYDNIYWISAFDQAALLSGFQEIGSRTGCLSMGTSLKSIEAARNVLSWLRRQKNWLLVLDNLDDISVADGFLPAMDTGGHILITTRNPNAKNIPAEGVEIPVFCETDAVELLRNQSEITEADDPFGTVAAEIVGELGYLALAIDSAAAFIRTLSLDATEFLPIYRKSRKQVLSRDPTSAHSYPKSVAITFLLSFDKVKIHPKYGMQASKLLQFFLFLNHDEILIDFLRAGSSGVSNELRMIIEDELVFHESLGLLQQFSLIRRSRANGSIVIHRLVYAVLRDEISEPEVQQCLGDVIGICNAAFPKNWDTLEKRRLCRKFQNQVVEPAFEAATIPSQRAGIALNGIGRFLLNDGKFKDSERLNERSYDIFLKLLGNEHPNTLATMSNLASIYGGQGKLQDAADLQKRVLDATKRTKGTEHPNTLTSMNNLAMTYLDQGKLQDAANLQEQALEADRRTRGDEHPSTLTSMNNLAMTYMEQGKLQEAVDLQEKTLQGQMSTLGEDNPDTLTTMCNLAWLYRDQEKLQEAMELDEKALKGSQRMLGKEHPATLISMASLALTYLMQGKLQEAVDLLESTLEISERTLGGEHPTTVERKTTLSHMRNLINTGNSA
jgi:tetratricopeptide (TPR) repeat protein